MHDNVDIAKELQETRQLFNSVLLTQSQKSSGGSGKKGDDALLEIAKDILGKVLKHFSFITKLINESLLLQSFEQLTRTFVFNCRKVMSRTNMF